MGWSPEGAMDREGQGWDSAIDAVGAWQALHADSIRFSIGVSEAVVVIVIEIENDDYDNDNDYDHEDIM
jgi:hypothetical protein